MKIIWKFEKITLPRQADLSGLSVLGFWHTSQVSPAKQSAHPGILELHATDVIKIVKY